MKITDPAMHNKMLRALKEGNDLYDLDDIENALDMGHMQGHVVGDTWAITQVHDFPKKRVVNVVFVIGAIDETIAMEKYITDWAKEIGAKAITAVGREGWWQYRTSGWKRMGTLYSKEI